MTPETDGIVVSHKRKDYHSDGFAWTRKTFLQLEVAQWCDRVKSYGWVYHYEWQHLIHYWYQNIYYSSSKEFICTRQTNSPNCARQANEQKVKEYGIQLSTAARVCISRRLHPQGWKNSLQRRDGRALVLDRREKQRQTHTHTHTIPLRPSEMCSKITGCQAVFTVFSLPGGPSFLVHPASHPPSFSNTTLHCFFPQIRDG